MAPFKPALPPSSTRQPFQMQLTGDLADLLAAFSPETLLLLGALVQCLAVVVLPLRYAITPALLLTLIYLSDTFLQVYKITPNRKIRGAIMGRTSAQLPSAETGSFSSRPAAEQVVVFHLSARFNHPLGIFAPGVKDIGDLFIRMHKNAVDNSTKYGLLGASSFASNEKSSASDGKIQQNLNVYYFRTVEGLNAFANSEVHREGVRWWNRTKHEYPHIGIMHETYEVPAGGWETIYENFQPTGLGAASIQVAGKDGVGEQWVSPLIAGSKGAFRSQYGRMGRTDGGDNGALAVEP